MKARALPGGGAQGTLEREGEGRGEGRGPWDVLLVGGIWFGAEGGRGMGIRV